MAFIRHRSPRRCRGLLFLVGFLVPLQIAIGSSTYHLQGTLPEDGTLAFSGDRMAIGVSLQEGDNSGSVIHYEQHGKFWVEKGRIFKYFESGGFATSLALIDDWLVVSAPYGNRLGNDPGGASGVTFYYERVADAWVGGEPSGGSHSGSFYGQEIRASDSLLVLTVPGYQISFDSLWHNLGSASVFQQTADGPRYVSALRQSNHPQYPVGGDGVYEGDHFASAIAVSGIRVVASAPAEDSAAVGVGGESQNEDAEDSGAVYVFELQGDEMVETAYIKATDTAPMRNFGNEVAISGDRIAVADLANIHTYVFNGTEWEPRGILPGTNPVMHEDMMLIGSKLYEFDTASEEWGFCQTLPISGEGRRYFFGSELYADGKIFSTTPLQRLYVNAVSQPGGDGSSWGTALNNLQDAIEAARASPTTIDEIWIAGGVYYPDDGSSQRQGDPTSTFEIPADVTLRGGFEGGETDLIDRQPDRFPTILSGDLGQDDTDSNIDGIIEDASDVNGVNAWHVVTVQNSWIRLDQLTITAGSADGTGELADSQGGGVRVTDGGLVIQNCDLTGNRASTDGGAIFAYGSHLDIQDGQLTGNRAVDDGGAIYAWLTDCQIRRCHISGNLATDRGGAVYLTDTDGYIADSLVSGNVAENSGGGLFIKRASAFGVFNCTLAGNFANTCGGGTFIEMGQAAIPSPTPLFANTVIWGNATADGNLDSGSVNLQDEGVSDLFPQFSTNIVQSTNSVALDDPQFTGPLVASLTPRKGGDYHPLETSPLINSVGLEHFSTSRDLDGTVRRSAHDIGAYETLRSREKTFEEAYPSLDPLGDSDGDDLPNSLEYESGSDPLSIEIGRAPLSIWKRDGTIVLEYYEHPNRGNSLLLEGASNTGGPWTSVGEILEVGSEWVSTGSFGLPGRDPTKDPDALRRLSEVRAGDRIFFRLRTRR